MNIDIFHDTVCAWCRIGERNLALALADLGGTPVSLRYHPFMLDPSLPPSGVDFRAHTTARKGAGALPAHFAGPEQAGRAVGLTFRFDRIEKAPNTLLSHALIAATPLESQPRVVEAIYRAYFEEGRDIGRLEVLEAIAAENDLHVREVAERLRDPAHLEVVGANADEARRREVRGVPLFLIGESEMISGAQPPDVMRHALELAAERVERYATPAVTRGEKSQGRRGWSEVDRPESGAR